MKAKSPEIEEQGEVRSRSGDARPLNFPIRQPAPLGEVAKAVSLVARARNVSEVAEAVRLTARKLIGCEGIAIIRKDGDLCHYIEEDAIGPLWKGQKFPMMACVSGWSMMHRETVVIPDISMDDRIPYELYAGTFVRAMAMAPVAVENPTGSIGAYWSRPYEPTSYEVEILEALASAAAAASQAKDFDGGFKPVGPREVSDFAVDIARVQGIAAVPAILDVALRLTGMGFAAVARVTEDRWIACQVLDHLGFGLVPGGELAVKSTLCDEIRDHRQCIVIDDVSKDEIYREHHTPRTYGLNGYISIPIILSGDRFWGTLCAIDPKPARVSDPAVLGAFKLFAELIGHHLDAAERLEQTEASLVRERELAELRENFVAILGHDLRNPVAALDGGITRLQKDGWTERSPRVLSLMKASVGRMTGLIGNVLDVAQARLGDGIKLSIAEASIEETIMQVVDELRIANLSRVIDVDIGALAPVAADHSRLAQMLSNLVANALTHGAPDTPVVVSASVDSHELLLSVSNGGPPITVHQIDKLFQPFQRGGGSTNVHGLGLGLYIASEIAKAHGGTISVVSDDSLTRFSFRMTMTP